MARLSDRHINTAKDAEALVDLLVDAGKWVPPRLRVRILTFGPEVIAPLVRMMQDPELRDEDGPGKGWAPIHAVELLGELRASEAVQPMLRLLLETNWETYIHDRTLEALPRIGAPVLEPALAAHAATADRELQISFAGILARLGVRDERIYNMLIEDLKGGLEMGATPYHLAEYGEPRALPHLLATLDGYEPRGGGPLADFGIGDLEDAIRRLGGQLTPEQQKKIEQIARQAYSHQRPGRKVGRNDPCPCGSGKKYKKCCLGKS